MDITISEDNLYCFSNPKKLLHEFEDRVIEIGFSTTCMGCRLGKRLECWNKIERLAICYIRIYIQDRKNKIYFDVYIDADHNITSIYANRDENADIFEAKSCDCNYRSYNYSHCHKCCGCTDHDDSEYTDDFIESFYNTDSEYYTFYGDTPTKSTLWNEYKYKFCIRDHIMENGFPKDNPDRMNILIKHLKYFAIATDFFDREIFRLNSKEAIFHRFMRLINGNSTKSARKY